MTDNARFLLSKIVEGGSFQPLIEAGVTEDYFLNPADQSVFKVLADSHRRHGCLPSVHTLRIDFPEYKLVRIPDPVDALVDRVRKDYTGTILQMTINGAADTYNEGDFDLAREALAAGLAALTTTSGEVLHTVDLVTLADKWVKDRTEYRVGVPFGIGPIDDETGGVYPDQLVTLIGPPGSAKSAHLLHMALSATEGNHRVLFVTIEMSDEHHLARAVANRAGVEYRKIRRGGDLTDQEERRIATAIERIHDDDLLHVQEIPASLASLETIKAQIVRYNPDIVYIDGAYLMQLPDVRANAAQWERLSALTREMKSLILQTHRPIVITTQALLSKMQGGAISAASTGYSSSFHQDSDIMLGIQPDPDHASHQVVKLLKFRDGKKLSVDIMWDWDYYRFRVLVDETEEM